MSYKTLRDVAVELWNDYMIATNDWRGQYMDKERFIQAIADHRLSRINDLSIDLVNENRGTL